VDDLKQKAATLLREYITDRRRTPRRTPRYASRLSFSVCVLEAGQGNATQAARRPSLAGRTRDLGEADLTLIVPSIRIGGEYITLEDNRLLITLTLRPAQSVCSPRQFALNNSRETERETVISSACGSWR
jgi:hypothetical protein